MARTAQAIADPPDPPPAEPRPQPVGEGPGEWFYVDLGPIYISNFDADSIIMCPRDYSYARDDSLDAPWRTGYDTRLCWKTCLIYKQISTAHRRLVPFIRPDAWTGFPILARPSGPPLKQFLAEHKSELYPQALVQSAACRVVDRCRPLVYQWALHALSALAFMHSHDVVCGDFSEDLCLLSALPSLSLSVVGFPFAGYRRLDHGGRYYEAEFYGGDAFSETGLGPKQGRDRPFPTRQFDLYQWACMVFRLMTSYFPGDRMGLNETEIGSLVSQKAWPVLEPEFMGDIIRKSWNGDYNSAEEIKRALISLVEEQGWSVNDGDDLQGFDATGLFQGSSEVLGFR